jgi:hypothetical protein
MLQFLLPKTHHKFRALPLLESIADGFDDWLSSSGDTPGSRKFSIRFRKDADEDLRKRGVREIDALSHSILYEFWRDLIQVFPSHTSGQAPVACARRAVGSRDGPGSHHRDWNRVVSVPQNDGKETEETTNRMTHAAEEFVCGIAACLLHLSVALRPTRLKAQPCGRLRRPLTRVPLRARLSNIEGKAALQCADERGRTPYRQTFPASMRQNIYHPGGPN